MEGRGREQHHFGVSLFNNSQIFEFIIRGGGQFFRQDFAIISCHKRKNLVFERFDVLQFNLILGLISITNKFQNALQIIENEGGVATAAPLPQVLPSVNRKRLLRILV